MKVDAMQAGINELVDNKIKVLQNEINNQCKFLQNEIINQNKTIETEIKFQLNQTKEFFENK